MGFLSGILKEGFVEKYGLTERNWYDRATISRFSRSNVHVYGSSQFYEF